MPARKRIFQAVFPAAAQATLPTPQATPVLGPGSFGGSSFTEASPTEQGDPAAEKIKWERAWHTATFFLKLPDAPITLAAASRDEASLRAKWLRPCRPETSAAITYLVSEQSRGRRLRTGRKEDDLLDWYAQEVGRHYIEYQLPLLLHILAHDSSQGPLSNLLRVLEVEQAIYLHPFKHYVLSNLSSTGRYELSRFQGSYHAMVAMSLSQSSFSKHLAKFLKEQGSIVLGLSEKQRDDEDVMEDDSNTRIQETRQTAINAMESLDDVGLGGAQAQRIFAEVMSSLLTTHVNTTYAGQWTSPSAIPAQLKKWVENRFSRFVVQILACLGGDPASDVDMANLVTLSDVGSWKQRAISDLGALRLKELFEVIVDWDNDSKGAIEDLKQYITTTVARAHLTTYFSSVISHRLLQPGASTTEILQVYICIIRAFAILDPKGVLLDRLARPIRRYLRDRDDTVKIIVGGLLTDPSADNGPTDVLVELANELNKITDIAAENHDGDLDWDDMLWMPDPVDAGPDYKKSKSADVIGTLISLFDTKDVFVKEFQNILGERLLKPEFDFDKEIRVLELLKLRFGDGPLQACEVMLKDVQDSRRTDAFVKREQSLQHSEPTLSAKILSRLFWPSLHAETFKPPPEIAALQSRYAAGFESFKTSRKLTWLPALGQVSIELQLADRLVAADVHTWQASVIHAFQAPETAGISRTDDEPVTKTVAQLAAALEMDTPLVANALTFWVGKSVLAQTGPDAYTVLERLAGTDTPATTSAATADGPSQASLAAAAASAAAASTVASAVRSEAEVANEQMEVFWQYIVGMLTNQGAMPLARIVMMLNLVVPGGFSYGQEELRAYLERRIGEGKVELVGGSYRVVKEKA